MAYTRHGVNSIPELELMANFGIDYLKKMELELGNLKKKKIYQLIYHFYNVNTYMWCYQYTGTKMIQNFG